jgi:hypothetical protein
VGRKFDLQLLLHKVDIYLESRAPEMFGEISVQERAKYWRWFKLADGAGLTVCMPAIAKRITEDSRCSCQRKENLHGLSEAAYQVLVYALADW